MVGRWSPPSPPDLCYPETDETFVTVTVTPLDTEQKEKNREWSRTSKQQ